MSETLSQRFWNLHREQQFHPGFWSIFLNPFHLARRGLRQHVAELAPRITGRTLDVGCGTKPYRRYCASNQYIGLEIGTSDHAGSPDADVFYDGKTFPFPAAEFDSALANQVLEHVFNPVEFLGELRRVLKPGGRALITVPFVWDEHEQPWDYARYSSFGLKHLFQTCGFSVLEHRKSGPGATVLFQLLIVALYRKGLVRSPKLNLMLTPFLVGPLNLLALLLIPLFPRNEDLFLDNILLVERNP